MLPGPRASAAARAWPEVTYRRSLERAAEALNRWAGGEPKRSAPERERENSVRTRNARLAAIHSLFRFAALHHPERAAVIQRVLAMPPKRSDRALITYLAEPEIDALLAAPDQTTWVGRRDHALLLLAIQTGLRASELIGLSCGDLHLGTGAHLSCHGKGRKDRVTPLTSGTLATLTTWLKERAGDPTSPVFPTSRGRQLSRDAIEPR